MPTWLVDLNWWFPFRHMAVVVRAALTSTPDQGVMTAYLVLGAWTLASIAAAGWALTRRP
jgi:ABC-2 type transport system permease protein